MAEFTEVMKHWVRMCEAHCKANDDDDDCAKCVLGGYGGEEKCGAYAFDNAKYADEIESVVMDWAEQHPEPDYPTWGDYLVGVCNSVSMTNIWYSKIPADIAKRLGIEPKGGSV